MEKINTIDLFSGCGGMSLGFQNAGFNISAAYDNWDPAVEVHTKNFKHSVYNKDLSDVDVIAHISKYSPDIIVGGPPCQDFSIAGKRKLGARADLTVKFAEIVSEIKPKWFVFENVYNIEKKTMLEKVIQLVKKAGYGITSRVLDASYCGVPQARKRYFMIGLMNAEDGFLNTNLDSNLSEKKMTIHDYLGNSLETEFYYMHPRSYKRRAVFSIHEPSSTIRGVNRPIPDKYKKHHGDKADVADGGVRPLTTKERSYIQTFPEWFTFTGVKTKDEQLIGNAVPVKLAEYVANCIKEYELKLL
ncbi:DNA cytosine methyltransferase [Staphylococcus equorum]|uniref:DNA cytosine methyltransferase n=2 Tax=Staphylococcus equorum TaxID=246432 RepID=UPI003EBBD04D